MKPKQRELSKQEFLSHLKMLIDYWDKEVHNKTTHEKMEGLVFSILATIDGESADLPAYRLIPMRKYKKDEVDIAGNLHNEFKEL